MEDDHLSCTLPNGDDPAPTPAPGVPTESDLQLSVDVNGQLVVDLVLADGTTEPIWIYERAALVRFGRTLTAPRPSRR